MVVHLDDSQEPGSSSGPKTFAQLHITGNKKVSTRKQMHLMFDQKCQEAQSKQKIQICGKQQIFLKNTRKTRQKA
jgi:hypothetical protein